MQVARMESRPRGRRLAKVDHSLRQHDQVMQREVFARVSVPSGAAQRTPLNPLVWLNSNTISAEVRVVLDQGDPVEFAQSGDA
jgi:hypothetical protein